MSNEQSERVHMNTSPSLIIDDSIFEEMVVLEQLIAYHQKQYAGLDGRYGQLDMPFPPEIQDIINTEIVQNEWNLRQYDQVRIFWAEAWMIYYRSIYVMEPSYTAEEYAHISATSNT